MMHRVFFSCVVAVCAGLAAGCAGSAQTGVTGPEAAGPAASVAPASVSLDVPGMEAYVDTLSGTTVTFEMIPVPGGTVTVQGQTVEVRPFWIGKTELSWDEYDVWAYQLDRPEDQPPDFDTESRPSKPYVLPGESFGHQGNPALAMTFKAAQKYTEWLSEKTGHTYRLPTEAEWEHACKLGMLDAPLDEVAWYWDNANSQAHKIDSKPPDRLGLHNMRGNVKEWVVGVDGTPVTKGGSWMDDAEDVSCEARSLQVPAWNVTDPQLPKSTWWLSDGPFIGFRLVREPSNP
ncbi:hypothetical protein AWN76_003085 [Rhodothermaceae bacterium RA]|nr:hypothetical protein AWN76_003085 [Rhodothermaceae bacterium RA]